MNPGTTAPATRRHIIKRPRLIRLLDASESRVLMLIAPAGYGKTLLAKEWLVPDGVRRSTWYHARESSSDVAALTMGLAKSVLQILPSAGTKVLERLAATQRPEAEVAVLAEMLSEDLAEWPEDAWLVIDDYHHLLRSDVAERFVERLTDSPVVNLFVISRVRPSWATPRRLLYGDFHELNRSALAMTHDEATQVFGSRDRHDVAGLVALAEGWPAVIGLAAMVGSQVANRDPVPEELHQFFAEELFQAADPEIRDALVSLSLLPEITTHSASSLLGPAGARALETGEHLGFYLQNAETYDLHPLLRAFLREKLRMRSSDLSPVLSHAMEYLADLGEWDEIFSILTEFGRLDELPSFLEHALYPLLAESRVATLEQWIDTATRCQINDPRIRLMQAEILFRSGNWAESERLAASAASELPTDSKLGSKAFYCAGQSAQFGDRHAVALTYHQRARAAASIPADLSQALWGTFITQSELKDFDEAHRSLEEFEAARTDSTEDELRYITSRLSRAVRSGGLTEALRVMHGASHLLSRPCDPVVRAGALQMYATGLNLAARYGEAREIADREVLEAQTHRLTFVLPHAYVNQAYAYLGQRMFALCDSVLDAANDLAADQDDIHSKVNVKAMRARLLIATRQAAEALDLFVTHWDREPSPGMQGDYLATHAVAAACAGNHDLALKLIDIALGTSAQIDCRVQCMAARTILAIRSGSPEHETLTGELVRETVETGNFDSLVLAYRGFPSLLRELGRHQAFLGELSAVLARSRDLPLARRSGLELGAPPKVRLTRREREIHELLREGLSNREIAQRLWISEPTVKVHLRHLFKKFGVRTRTEAALKEPIYATRSRTGSST